MSRLFVLLVTFSAALCFPLHAEESNRANLALGDQSYTQSSTQGQQTNSAKTSYWTDQPRVTQRSNSSRSYTAAMHNRFAGLQPKYQENGEFFYSNYTDSFGQKQALNPDQEVVFCGAGDLSFNDTIEWLQQTAPSAGFVVDANSEQSVRYDSSTIGFGPEQFDTAVRRTLTNNGNQTAKGRFCYDVNDVAQNVDYRTPGAEREVFCDPASEPELLFSDPVSGFSCQIQLDAPLKVGETKFMRQLQTGVSKTIAQGFAGCYRNEVSGLAEFKLIENPSSCTSKNRDSCNYTCEWAHKMICDAKLMPRWGGGKCGALPTVIFKGDVLPVSSSDQLSYSKVDERLYVGEALMQCSLVGGQAQWVITSEECQIKQ